MYKGRREPFNNLDELKKRIRKVWKDSYNLDVLQKAINEFRARLKSVVSEDGGPIKYYFG